MNTEYAENELDEKTYEALEVIRELIELNNQ